MKKVKATVKSNATASKTTQQAREMKLDVKQSHRMRQRLADTVQVDLFALHSLKKASKGYCELCAENAKAVIDGNKGKEATHVLVAGAVANKVTFGKDGFYSRAHGSGQIVGHLAELQKLYGKDVSVFAIGECEKRFADIKETVSRRIGAGKSGRTIVGKEFASDGVRFAMWSRLDNGKLAIFNGEFESNAYNYAVRASTLKTFQDTSKAKETAKDGAKKTVVKDGKIVVASEEQRAAEKIAAQG